VCKCSTTEANDDVTGVHQFSGGRAGCSISMCWRLDETSWSHRFYRADRMSLGVCTCRGSRVGVGEGVRVSTEVEGGRC